MFTKGTSMRIAKKSPSMKKRTVRASEEIVEQPAGDVDVTDEATDILFETEDVAQLLAEVTEEDVTADVDDKSGDIIFTVADDEYVVEPEEDAELLEACTRPRRSARRVSASSRRVPSKRAGRVSASSRRTSGARRVR